jgi:dihydroorotate dehydrogenase electron transfer subunit
LSRLFKASIVENKQIIKNHFLLTLHPSSKIKMPKPGTFFMLSVNSGLDPLLKRPISIHRWLGGDFQLLYRVVGKGTDILSRRKPGDILEVLGPLGNGFTITKKQSHTILIAGGLGIAPIFGLAETLISPLIKTTPLIFYGARTKQEALCLDQYKPLGIDPIIATDDGTLGEKGNVVNILSKYLNKNSRLKTQYSIYACGPEPMLKAVSVFAVTNNIRGFISLEKHMACGVGTCLGCVVNTTKGYKRVCKEGPVFPVDEIVWE